MGEGKATRALTLEESILSSYERGVMEMAGETKADRLVKDASAREAMRAVLGTTLTRRLPDGTQVQATALELAVIGAVSDMIQKPSIAKIKDMASVLGELKDTTQDVSISIVDQSIQALALKEGGDDAGGR